MICQYCKSEWNMHEGTTCNTAQVLYMSFKMSSAGRDKWIAIRDRDTSTLAGWYTTAVPAKPFNGNHRIFCNNVPESGVHRSSSTKQVINARAGSCVINSSRRDRLIRSVQSSRRPTPYHTRTCVSPDGDGDGDSGGVVYDDTSFDFSRINQFIPDNTTGGGRAWRDGRHVLFR